jgi:hypothetical protein
LQRIVSVLLLVGLAACNSGPRPGVGIGVNSHGVTAYPHLSGSLAGVGVNIGGLIR